MFVYLHFLGLVATGDIQCNKTVSLAEIFLFSVLTWKHYM